ncbi:DUF4382 domain-containing protein [Gemmatimonadota bacterium]
MKNYRTRKVVGGFLSIVVLIAGISACSSTDPSGSGSLQLTLVDAPAPIDGIEAIDVTFSSILIHRTSSAELDDANWIVLLDDELSEAERTFNLLEYVNGAAGVLGTASLESGHYSQIRIIIESASITIDGVESDLTILSGTVSGLKLTHAFSIDSNVITEIILDFDAGESVSEVPVGSGQYRLQPTIRTVTKVVSGTISGTVTPTGISAMVIAYDAGTTDVVTSTYVDTLTGDYVLPALLEGSYDLEAVAEGYVTDTEAGVTVTAQTDSGGHDFILSIDESG